MFLSSRYELLSLIAKGRYGEVYKALDCYDEKEVTIKEIQFHNIDDGFPYEILRDMSLLRELSHKNVVRLLKVERLPLGGCRLIFEYGEYDLFTYMREHSRPGYGLDSCRIKKLLLQILKGLNYCHSQKVMHRDLKPHNILIDPDGIVKLANFCLNWTFDVPRQKYSLDVGTLEYSAPEILLGLPYTNSIDIWAVGCIFAEMVRLRPLFEGTTRAAMIEHIVSILGMPTETDLPGSVAVFRNEFNVEEPNDESRKDLASLVPGLEDDGLDLLQRMLCLNPHGRITATKALLHPYFKEFQLTAHSLLDEEYSHLHYYMNF